MKLRHFAAAGMIAAALGLGAVAGNLAAPPAGVTSHTMFGSGDDLARASIAHCGVERWSVKTGTDPLASSMDLSKVTDTTIQALGQLPVPPGLTQDSPRFVPQETQVYRVQATLIGVKMESDSDYHLVLSDGQGHTMIAEIPDPSCAAGSPWLPQIAAARAALEAQLTPTGSFQTVSIPVTVTGAGFFDFPHGQSGVAPNAIELHPVLGIQFGTAG